MTLSQLSHHKSLAQGYPQQTQSGFSLIEMAIVIVILGMLMAGLMVPLSSQYEKQKRTSTEQQLEEIRTALLGFVQLNNNFPCPASPASNGQPATGPGGACTFANGFVPNASLGLAGATRNGLLLDGWNNPIHYRLTNINNWEYAKTPIPFPIGTPPNFQICTASTCTPAQIAVSNVVAVIFSTGFDTVKPTPDQNANTGGGTSFVMHEINETPGTEFDDIVVWIARPELIYALSKTR